MQDTLFGGAGCKEKLEADPDRYLDPGSTADEPPPRARGGRRVVLARTREDR